MKFRRPRFVLKQEDLDSTPIVSNPFRYVSFFTPFTMILLIALLLYWIHIRRGKRLRVSKLQGRMNDCEEKFHFIFMKTISPDRVSFKPLALEVSGTFGKFRRGMYKDSSTSREVAVKLFETETIPSKVREACRLLQMQHPNIVEFIGISGELNGPKDRANFGIITPWHIRGSLYDHLKVNTLSYSQLLYLAESIATGLKFLHFEGILVENGRYKPAMAHRNIKSRNILLKDNRTACVADLDSVAVIDPVGRNFENSFKLASGRYMAPEILEGRISWTRKSLHAADMYAVSIVLWEMLSRTAVSDESPEYRVPLQEHIGASPTLIQLRDIVLKRRLRPWIRKAWRTDERFVPYITIMEDCWDSDPRVRWSARKLQKRLRQLISFVESIPNNRTILSSS